MKKSKTYIFSLLLTISALWASGQQNPMDSLWESYKDAKHDTLRIQLLLDIGNTRLNQSPDSALMFFQQALILADKALSEIVTENKTKEQILITGKFHSLKARSLLNKGIAHYYQNNYDVALQCYFEALKITEISEDKIVMNLCCNNIGNVYSLKGEFNKAIEYYLISLSIRDELGDRKGSARSYSNIGVSYQRQGKYDKALEHYFKSLDLMEELGDKAGMSGCFQNIGTIFENLGSYQKALEYYKKSLEIDEISGDRRGMSTNYGNLGNTYHELGMYDLALEYQLKSLKIYEELQNQRGISMVYMSIAGLYYDKGNNIIAEEYFNKSLKISEYIDAKEIIANNYNGLALLHRKMADSLQSINITKRKKHIDQSLDYALKAYDLASNINTLPVQNEASSILQKIYTEAGNYKEALKYAEIFITTRDSLYSEEKTKALTEMSVKYETEKKVQQIAMQEIELEKRSLEVKQKKTQRNAFIGGFTLVLLLAAVIYIGYTQKQKANRLLTAQRAEILDKNAKLEKANQEIAEKNKNILDSIRYAKRIQEVILPPEKIIKEKMEESFVFSRPKDIVSGDFYWMEVVRDKILFAAVDCTGHGVPGALVSIIGYNGLNRAVRELGLTKPSEILDMLNYQVQETFEGNEEHDVKDGMDIALCCLNSKNNTLEYAGANNPLYILRNKELQIVNADKQPVGKFAKRNPFTNHTIQLQYGDCIYIFSDGYTDQFGGPHDKRFTLKRFRELLLAIHDQPMQKQKKLLTEKFDEWKNTSTQIDDVLVMGIRPGSE